VRLYIPGSPCAVAPADSKEVVSLGSERGLHTGCMLLRFFQLSSELHERGFRHDRHRST